PARAGELVRAHWLGLDTGLPRTSIIGSIVLDQLVNAAGLLLGLALLPFFVGVPLWIRPGGAFALGLFVLGTILVLAIQPRGGSGARRRRGPPLAATPWPGSPPSWPRCATGSWPAGSPRPWPPPSGSRWWPGPWR